VLFIPTANVADTIPAPLLDRMELIRLDGYTEEEKLGIARRHLVPRQFERNGLDAGEVSISDAALERAEQRIGLQLGELLVGYHFDLPPRRREV